MRPRSPSLVAGLRIGSYELMRRIGRGGMAEVWCARRKSERRASKFVAIKVVADPYVGDPRYQRMFRAEAELSGLLSHANIVQVFDEGESGGRSYLVMEWVDGVNLLKIATALRYANDEHGKHRIVAYVIGQLLHALGYAHGITLHDGNPLGIVPGDPPRPMQLTPRRSPPTTHRAMTTSRSRRRPPGLRSSQGHPWSSRASSWRSMAPSPSSCAWGAGGP